MTCRAARIAAAAALLLPFLTVPGPLSAQVGPRRVYTRGDLDAAGIVRLSELIQWVTPWSATVDGVAWSTSADGLPGGGLTRELLPDLALVVNGQRVSVDAHGAWMPDLAPIAVQQIDSVVVTRGLAVAGGTVGARGSIAIFARSAPAGPAVVVALRSGAQTGDPGPYFWTDRGTPNVDRTGPDRFGSLSYGADAWELEVTGRYHRQDVSDRRLHAFWGDRHPAFVPTRGPTLRAAWSPRGGRHEVLLGRMEQLGAGYFADVATLVHASITATHLGLVGRIPAGATSAVTYRLTHGLATSEHPTTVPVVERRVVTHGSVGASAGVAGWEIMGSLAADRTALEPGATNLPAFEQTQGTGIVEAGRATASGARHHAVASLTRVGRRWGKGIAVGYSTPFGGSRHLAVTSSWTRALADAPYRADAWLVAAEGRPAGTDLGLFWSEVLLSQGVGTAWTIDGTAMVGAVRAGDADPRSDVEGGTIRFEGARAGVDLGIGFRNARVRARFDYQGMTALGGSEAHEQAARLVPTHSARWLVAYSPRSSFRLSAAGWLRSETRWEVGDPLRGDPHLPGVTRVDLSAEKWLWDRRLRGQLLVRNVIDTPEIHHPAGADFDLRYFISMTAALPNLP